MLYSDSSSGMDTFEAMRQDQTQAFGIGSDKYAYELRVIQQPLRARMCGFGEKDRRPCTPPPILELKIYDRASGRLINIEQIDTAFFTATCSLYSVDKRTDMDLISQQRPPNDSGNASASSGGTAVATQQISTRATNFVPVNSNDADKTLLANSPASMEGDASSDAMAMVMSPVHSQSQLRPFSDEASSGFISGPGAQNRGLGQHLANSSSIMSFSAGIETNFDSSNEGSSGGNGSNSDSPVCTVRNLIGASVTTGAKLNNVDGSLGIFFVFPDLSVRKDGDYRFRFSFFDLKSSDSGDLMRATTYIKARVFSEPFRVYSAKQFPGMIESTTLSKHFAKQGVKIPVRKETIGKSRHSPDDDDWQN